MTRLSILLLGPLFFLGLVPANSQMVQSDIMKLSTYAERISEVNVRKHLEILSADEMEGREAGHPGNLRAAQYLADQLSQFGYKSPARTSNYFQYFPLYKQHWENIGFTVDGRDFLHLTDYYSLPSQNPNLPTFQGEEIVYLGYGQTDKTFNDFEEADLANRVVIIREGKPDHMGPSRTSELEPSKLEAARESGVRLILVVSPQFTLRVARYRPILANPSISTKVPESRRTNVVYISPAMADQIMRGYEDDIAAYDAEKYATSVPRKKVNPVVIRKDFDIRLHKITGYEYVPNVVGYLPGKDPVLQHELLVISAHFDHLGKRGDEIYNGADDDGSGTATILEIARVISELGEEESDFPRRSLLIFFANAEEKGLLGSAYYAENPLYPLKNTVVNLNVDMIGRRDEAHRDNPYYVYIIGSDKLSSDLHHINESVNQSLTNLELDYTYNDEADPNRFYYRSDHYNFAKHGIPVIFYFTGVHEDYHKPTDTIEKIEFPKMLTIGQLIFGTAWEVLNRDHRPVVDKD